MMQDSAVTIAEKLGNFSVDVPEYFNWGFDVTDRWAENSSKPALIYTDDDRRIEKYTFQDIKEKSNQLANFLANNRIGKADPVLLMLPNIPILWVLIVALFKLGAIIVPSATTLTEKDLEYRITTAGIRGVITNVENSGKFSQIVKKFGDQIRFLGLVKGYSTSFEKEQENSEWANFEGTESQPKYFRPREKTEADDIALMYFTSGTEGPPKIVAHTHASYPLGHRGTALWLGLKDGYIHWNISSPGWAKHAWSSVFAPWNAGAATFAYNYRGGFNASDHLGKISQFGVNSLCAPPTIWRMFILQDLSKFDFSSLKEVASAGEPLNPEVIERFRKVTGLTIRDGYGQTETVLQVGNFPGVKVRPGSMGVPCPLYHVDVVNENGEILPPGTEGNVAIRVSPNRPFALFKGYVNDPQRNAEAFRNGWYYTGDRAYKDEEGYFWYVGRADDVIKSSGYRIGPFEVESALIKHPAVAEAAAVASPDVIRGAVVKAYIVLKTGYAPNGELADELASFVAKETASYKHPRKIEFVPSLDPIKTLSGKIKRKELRFMEYGKEEKTIRGAEFVTKALRERS